MPELKRTILEHWPGLKEDLSAFLSDTDAWIISGLKQAKQEEDWQKVGKIIQVMEAVRDMGHAH